MTPIFVAITENQEIYMDGILTYLNEIKDIEVVGTALNGKLLFEEVDLEKTNVVLLDLDMPVMGGLETTELLNQKYPDISVVIMSNWREPTTLRKLLDLEIKGYIMKDNLTRKRADEAIRAVYLGNNYFDDTIKAMVAKLLLDRGQAQDEKPFRSSEQQINMLELTAQDLTNQEIGARLNTSEANVKYHKRKIGDRWGVSTKAGLIAIAIQKGFLDKDIAQNIKP